MKKRIVIIGAGCFQKALIEKAREMGLETHVFAWEQGAEGKALADYFYPVSITEKETILEYCKKIKPHAVTTIASELANITVQYLTEKLGLPGNHAQCVWMTTNKGAMRDALKKQGIESPIYEVIDQYRAKDYRPCAAYPLIVKPTDRSGSRGVKRVENDQELKKAIAEAMDHSFEKKVIVEEWISGEEYSCECLSVKGVHHALAITKKYTTGSPEYVETGHLEPAFTEDNIQIKEAVFRALDALQIYEGASHTEFKIDSNGKLRLIETGSRMGGDCIGSDLVLLSTGIDYVKNVILISLGMEPDLEQKPYYQAAAVRFILNDHDREILKMIKEDARLTLIYESLDEENCVNVSDSTKRSGYYIFAGNQRKAVEDAMEDLNED